MNFETYDYFWSLKSGRVSRSMKELFRQKHKPLRTLKKKDLGQRKLCYTNVDVSQSSGPVCVLMFSCVQLFATLWPAMWQAPLSMGFFRQEYWSGLPFSPPRATSLASAPLHVDSLRLTHQQSPLSHMSFSSNSYCAFLCLHLFFSSYIPFL